MEGLWLVIFILFIVFKMLGKIPNMKGKLPEETRNKLPRAIKSRLPRDLQTGIPPIIKEMGFPWEFWEEVEPDTPEKPPVSIAEQPVKVTPALPEVPVPTAPMPEKATVTQPMEAYAMAFEGDTLINGIIFSEILKPPRCKVRRSVK